MSVSEYLLKKLDRLTDRVNAQADILARLIANVEQLNIQGEAMTAAQNELDARVSRLSTAIGNIRDETTNVRTEVQALKDQVAATPVSDAIDFSGLDAAIAGLEDVTTVVEGEVAAPPAEEPVPAEEPPVVEPPVAEPTPAPDEETPVTDFPVETETPADDRPVTGLP